MRLVLATIAILAAVSSIALFGSVRALSAGSRPAQFRIVTTVRGPTNCAVRVTWPQTNEFRFSSSGEAVVEVPALPGSCSWVCFGITVTDGSPYNRKVIEVLRGDRVVQRLSLRQMGRLPTNLSGAKRLSF